MKIVGVGVKKLKWWINKKVKKGKNMKAEGKPGKAERALTATRHTWNSHVTSSNN